MRLLRLSILLPALTACAHGFVPPPAPAPRESVPVSASFARTWNAVIDVFAREVITIETIESSSGFIVASRAAIPARARAERATALALANCGHFPPNNNTPAEYVLPISAKYNVVVRGDSASSSVQVTAKFLGRIPAHSKPLIECASKGAFEASLERSVRELAERMQAGRP